MNYPSRIPFTKAGYAKMKARFDELTEKRPHILVRLQAAREMGDLSENGAYKAARFELSDCDRELRQLNYLVRMGKVVETAAKKDEVSFGTTVRLKNTKTNLEFMVVNEYEADPAQKKLSTKSPYGQAVMGKKVGDTITVHTPAGELTFVIEALL